MKFYFETQLPQNMTLNWHGWNEGPFASVCIQNNEDENVEAAIFLESILVGMDRLYTHNHHRAFVFFEFKMFSSAQRLVELAKASDQVEIFIELIENIENISKFDYLELQNYFSNKKSEKFLILSVAPKRKQQAQRLNIYEEF